MQYFSHFFGNIVKTFKNTTLNIALKFFSSKGNKSKFKQVVLSH